METFFIVMAVVFAPFLWFIGRAIRYTNETVGEDAPLRRERTYQFSAYQYFGGFTKLLIVFLFVLMLLIVRLLTNEAIRQHDFLIFLFALFFLTFAGFLGFYFYFDWHYWKITRNVSVTFNPEQATVEVNSPYEYRVFSADNVVRIEEHVKKTENSKDLFGGYGYYLFFTSDGNVTQVNTIFFGNLGQFEFMERYFAHVPKTTIQHRLPWPTNPQ